jgi:hypothetical protein
VGLWVSSPEKQAPETDEPNFAGIPCTEVRRLADAYAKGQLDAGRREQVRRHVVQCTHCAALYRSMGLSV